MSKSVVEVAVTLRSGELGGTIMVKYKIKS